jgi:hypothetical protein
MLTTICRAIFKELSNMKRELNLCHPFTSPGSDQEIQSLTHFLQISHIPYICKSQGHTIFLSVSSGAFTETRRRQDVYMRQRQRHLRRF